MIFELAVKAGMPLIEITTRDTINLAEVIKHITGRTPILWDTGPAKMPDGALFCLVEEPPPPGHPVKSKGVSEAIYNKLAFAESTLIVVNPAKPSRLAFRAGDLPVPRKLMVKFLKQIVDSEDKAAELVPALGGCTLKEAAEIARMTMTATGALTRQGLTQTRKQCFQGSNGVTQVDPHQWVYAPPEQLADWLAGEKDFFLKSADPRLIPRGLLFDGPPGVGKSEGAKWIANQLGVPLYRLDLGTVMNKYVGESEANMMRALSQLDNEEPCVALIDEVEKIFGTGHDAEDAGVSTRLLSQLLWWQAEHRSRVLTVMTTNRIEILPKELYRPGRIDAVMVFAGLPMSGALELGKQVLSTFPAGKKVGETKLAGALKAAMAKAHDKALISHADVTTICYKLVKKVSL